LHAADDSIPEVQRALIAGGLLAALVAGFVLWPREAAKQAGAEAQEPLQSEEQRGAPPSLGRGRPAGLAARALRDAVLQSGAPGSTPPVQQAASEKDGFVEVRVLAQGKPLGGAHVRLYLRGPLDRGTGQVDWRFAGAADTARDGVARVRARPGSYLAAARSGAFAPARREFQRPAGEPVTQVSLELQPGVTISGRTVTKGALLEPVPLALVTLTYDARTRAVRRPDAPAEEQVRVTSDARGRFRVDGLEPGPYLATAQATGFAKGSEPVDAGASKEILLELAAASFIEGRVLGADGNPAGGAEVLATGGEEAAFATASETGSFSLEVAPRTWSLSARRGDESGRADAPVAVAAGATARGVKIQLGAASGIAGTVVAAAGQRPVAGAQISVSPHGSNGDSGRAVSDATGTFAVAGLPPGSYDVAVAADGYSDATRRGVTVEAGQRFPLRVELRRTGALEGVVRDAAGRGVPYALVRGSQRFPGPGAAAPTEARSDESGAYRLAGVAAGRGSFSAMRDGSALGATSSADVPEGGTARLDFQLRDEGVLTGRVRRKDGSPPPSDATVRAFAGEGSAFRPTDAAGIPVDAAGVYIASVPAGTYVLSAQGQRAGGSFRNRTFATVEAGKTTTQDLVWLDAAEDAQGFSGTVLEPGGTPSPGAVLRASVDIAGPSRGFGFWLTTDESGRFHLDRPRADLPDSFTVFASNGGRTGQAVVAPGQSEVAVQLRAGATLRGHLAGGAVDSFRVEVRPVGGPGGQGGFGGTAQSLEFTGDRFELRDVPGQLVRVVVTTGDGRSATQDVPLAPEAVKEIEVVLQELATVAGRLIDAATAQPIPDAIASVDSPRFGQVDGFTSGADGRFRLRAAAGDHTLRALAPRYRGLAKSLTVQAGQQLELGDLALERKTAQPGTIGATLRGDSEQPPTVTSLIPDGPAEKAGMRAGDQVAAVDGTAVKGVADATRRLGGAPGSAVLVTVQRGGAAQTLTITRAP
jgi:hypothetical protein